MRRLLFLFLFSLSFLSAAARHIVGRVVDGKTHEDLAGAVVELLNPRDSSVIKSTTTTERQVFGWKVFVYQFDVDIDSTYLLRCSSLGYQTAYRCVTVRMANRVNEQQIDDIALQPDVHTLSEVVVKATKIRMLPHSTSARDPCSTRSSVRCPVPHWTMVSSKSTDVL